MKNPIIPILRLLPDDGSKVIVTKELTRQILALMSAADPKFKNMEQAEEFLSYLHDNHVVEITSTDDKQTHFIRKTLNGNQSY